MIHPPALIANAGEPCPQCGERWTEPELARSYAALLADLVERVEEARALGRAMTEECARRGAVLDAIRTAAEGAA